MRPTTVSNGGLSGALGWLRVGVKDFVFSNCRTSSLDCVKLSASSSLTRSSCSSSLIWALRFSQRPLMVGTKLGSLGLSFWNV